MMNFFMDLTSFTVAPPLYGGLGRMVERECGPGVGCGGGYPCSLPLVMETSCPATP